jgi:hypothetical protein
MKKEERKEERKLIVFSLFVSNIKVHVIYHHYAAIAAAF